MRWRSRDLCAAALALAIAGGAHAESGQPEAASLLFDEPQLAATKIGEVLTYDYHRNTSNDTLAFCDIELK